MAEIAKAVSWPRGSGSVVGLGSVVSWTKRTEHWNVTRHSCTAWADVREWLPWNSASPFQRACSHVPEDSRPCFGGCIVHDPWPKWVLEICKSTVPQALQTRTAGTEPQRFPLKAPTFGAPPIKKLPSRRYGTQCSPCQGSVLLYTPKKPQKDPEPLRDLEPQ